MRHPISIITIACAAGALAAYTHAADISFGSPLSAGNASTDFILGGTLDRAYDFGTNQKLIINGIEFDPFNTKLFGDTTNLDGPYDAYTTDGQTGDYATLLSHGDGHDNEARVIQFNNLVPGVIYTVEVVASGLRSRSDCCEAGAGYNNLFVSGDSPTGTGTLGWDITDATSRHIYGTFVSDATGRQALNINLFVSNTSGQMSVAQIHGVVLSYAAVPEPTAVLLFATGITGITGLAPSNRRRRPILTRRWQ